MNDKAKLFDAADARLLGAGRVKPDAAWAMPSHSHPYWEFVYFLGGSGHIHLPQTTFSLQAYHLVVYPPNLAHAEAANPFDPEETIFLSIEIPQAAPVESHLLLADPQGELKWLCEQIVNEHQQYGATLLAGSCTVAFLCLVDRLWQKGGSMRLDAVERAVQFIHAHYAQEVTLDELAKAACVSKTHLSHCFSAKLGISPLRYLQKVRMEVAKRLLSTTSEPIFEIAIKAGFQDPLYFSRTIRTATGLSPKQFRRQSNCTGQSISAATESISDQSKP